MSPLKSNQSDVAEIKPQVREQDLPELAVRILSDFARIVAAEARLIESNLVEAAQTLPPGARLIVAPGGCLRLGLFFSDDQAIRRPPRRPRPTSHQRHQRAVETLP